jgi:hypothetical protein
MGKDRRVEKPREAPKGGATMPAGLRGWTTPGQALKNRRPAASGRMELGETNVLRSRRNPNERSGSLSK